MIPVLAVMNKWGMQALMLPEAVRLLHLLVTNGKRVYVHCTAGINRATLTTVGYLTFVKVCCCAYNYQRFLDCKRWLSHQRCIQCPPQC